MMHPASIQRSRWTEADFDSLSWHDCTIHSISLDQDGEDQSDFLIDLDFITEWLPGPDNTFRFRVAPALLRFQNADKIVIHTLLDFKQAMQISEIARGKRVDPGFTNFHWVIKLHTYPGQENYLEFDATGFCQQLSAQPIITTRQSLQFGERLRMMRGDSEPGAPPNGGPATPLGNS